MFLQCALCIASLTERADVSVTSCADAVDWNRPCTLTCSAFGGTPPDYTLQWHFKEKFSDIFQVLTQPAADNPSELQLQSLDPSDAGNYRCNVTNLGGVSHADLDLHVNCQYHYTIDSIKKAL